VHHAAGGRWYLAMCVCVIPLIFHPVTSQTSRNNTLRCINHASWQMLVTDDTDWCMAYPCHADVILLTVRSFVTVLTRQEGLPRCIKQLANAGMRLWVLTGDKMETAINIGIPCSVITDEVQHLVISRGKQSHRRRLGIRKGRRSWQCQGACVSTSA
jgi:hypothetical protein